MQVWTAKHANVRINIPPLSVQKDELSITGEKDGVLAVKAAIVAIWKDMEKKCSTIQVPAILLLDLIYKRHMAKIGKKEGRGGAYAYCEPCHCFLF